MTPLEMPYISVDFDCAWLNAAEYNSPSLPLQ